MFDAPATSRKLVEIRDLKMHFPIYKGVFRTRAGAVKAVDGVSFDIYEGETLGLVGESGCGKSTCGRAILRLYDITEGSILMDGVEIGPTPQARLRGMRPKMQMVFQDPYGSLNPRKKIATILEEPVVINTSMRKAERRELANEMIRKVGLRPEHAERYPHMFSGGQRQRIAIARAMVLKPRFVVLDEPTSALDMSVQAQIVDLLRDLQRQHRLAYMFISHDLKVVRALADDVIVMKEGRVVEQGPRERIFTAPQQPYTQALMKAAFELEAVESGVVAV